jgi:hypothetical protein
MRPVVNEEENPLIPQKKRPVSWPFVLYVRHILPRGYNGTLESFVDKGFDFIGFVVAF